MNMKVACAPCCWGVEPSELSVNPSWGRVLVEAREAGYDGIELGPIGYFPDDPELLKSALRVRGLRACAGNLHEAFSDPSARQRIVEKAEKEVRRLAAVGVDKLLIMDATNTVRDAYVGQSVIAPRLNRENMAAMIATILEVVALAEQQGIRVLLHPSSGGYVAFEDEIAAVMNAIPANKLGLCLDVGHLYIDGMQPEVMLRRYANRLEHVHVKDIDAQQLHQVRRDRCGIHQAYSQSLTRPLGQGSIKLNEIWRLLKDMNYQGWLVVEQEHPVSAIETVKQDLAKSRTYLSDCGV